MSIYFCCLCDFLLTTRFFNGIIQSRKEDVLLNERLKKLRKTLDLTQQEFASRIGSVQNTITGYETGRRVPSNQVISLICREFNVNADWIKTGKGEMFLQTPDDALDALSKKYHLSYSARVLIEKFVNLKPEIQQAFIDYAIDIASALTEGNSINVSMSHLSEIHPPMTVEEAEAEYIKSKSASAQKTDLNASSSTAAEKSKLA